MGEATTATIRSMTISDCYAGIAVKDLSRATISNSTLRNLEVGIALYIKKPTFGPSQARLENVTMHDVATRVVKDDTCSLIE